MVRNNMSESDENSNLNGMNPFQQNLSQDSLSFDTLKGSQAFSNANLQYSIDSNLNNQMNNDDRMNDAIEGKKQYSFKTRKAE